MTIETINHNTLAHLVEAGSIRTATAVADGGGWALVVHYGQMDKTLQATNSGKVRTWAKFETLVKYLTKLGIRKFDTDATNYDPNHKPLTKRPNKAIALKRAHAAAEHDAWFRGEVEKSMNDTRPSLSHDEFVTQMDTWMLKKFGGRPQ